MPETFGFLPEVEAALKAQGTADLVVGIALLDGRDGTRDALATAQAGLAQSFPGVRAVVLHAHSGESTPEATPPEGDVPVLDLAFATPATDGPGSHPGVLRGVLEASRRLQARACAVIGREVTNLTPDWIPRLLAPVVEQEQDLVAPYYLRHPYSGAMITGIGYPLIRTLYGRRIRYPLGTEFACSARLIERYLSRNPGRSQPGSQSVELQLQVDAAAAGMRLAQAVLGPRTVVTSENPASLSGVLLDLLSPVFGEMERTTPIWQKVRGSLPVDLVGPIDLPVLEPAAIDPKPLIDRFRLGQRSLRDVWGLVHSPGTLVELKKLAGLPDADFAMPDRLWARILYDFSLAYHTRAMNREHLMGALVPLYLGWLGSLGTEMGDADPAPLEDRLEQLCLSYEAEKPYLISRWRWPDRFNP